MRAYAIYCLLGLWIVLSNISYTHAQTLPANLNLVSNGSFEFATCGAYYYNDSTFNNNPSCWISANRSRSAFLCPNAIYPNFNARARTGHSAFLLTRGYSRLQLSTGTWIDTPELYRTYAETKLLDPLVTGKKYYLKIYFGTILDTTAPTSASLHDQDIVSNVGVYFSNNILRDNVHGGQIKVVPQVNFTSHILPNVDSFMYIALSGTYIAQGGEQYLTIGNFDDLANTVFMHITKSAQIKGLTNSYMNSVFIDDISLVSDTTQPIISLDHFDLGNDTTLCAGNMRLGTQSYFFHYWWNTGDTTPFITINTPGTYWCTIDYGCGIYTDTIHIYPPVTAVRHADTLSLCRNQLPYIYRPAFLPTPNLPIHYYWSNGTTGDSLAITQAGTYQLIRSDACGYARDSIQVFVNIPGTTRAYLPDTTFCAGQSITLFAGAGYDKYLWNTGDSTASIAVSQPGKYSVLAYNMCDTLNGTATIAVEQLPPAFSLGMDTAICPNASIVLKAPPGYHYAWYPVSANQASIQVASPGIFVCTISNICGTSQDSITITALALLQTGSGIYGDSTLCAGGVLITGILYNHSAFSKIWNTGATTDEIKVSRPGPYFLTIYNECGRHQEDIYIHGCQGIIAFPNAFSPNGDGLNDVFRPIVQDRSLVDEYVMRIYNRWGQQVFISFRPDFGWNGSLTDIGTYFYVCKYKEKNGKEDVVKGTLELLR